MNWFERNTGQVLTGVQRRVEHPAVSWMAATLDGVVEATGAVFEAKFMLPWSFSEEGAAEKYMPQLQHNMWVTNAKLSVLSIITGGGKWVEIGISADPLYQHLLLTAEKKFWRCVESGEPPRLFGVEPPRPRIKAVRIVDMSASNSWAEFAGVFRSTRSAFLEHERSKAELKAFSLTSVLSVGPPFPSKALSMAIFFVYYFLRKDCQNASYQAQSHICGFGSHCTHQGRAPRSAASGDDQ
jgi:hypothetical protein